MAQRVGKVVSPITENALRAHIKFLSDDRLEGRGTGARGGELAALYVAQQFEAMGLKGAGAKGSFWQPVSLVGVKADPKTELRVNGSSGAETFKFADDFVAFTGAQTDHVNAKADLVFVGYGIDAPEQKWNDYKGSADDYRGKILVMLVNDPPATREEPDLFGGRRLTYYGRSTYKYEEAARRGAIVAILPGRDPKLRDEYVVYSAHWDHFGVGAPDKSGDTIYNGALDNATGVASVLEIARVLSQIPPSQRPRRSFLFLITTGEEQGLIGSEWYSLHPLVPLNKTAADINLDSMNILGPTADFVPLGAERSTLNNIVADIARERGLKISPDPRPEQGSFYRSDHFPFAKVCVPSIRLKEGTAYIG